MVIKRETIYIIVIVILTLLLFKQCGKKEIVKVPYEKIIYIPAITDSIPKIVNPAPKVIKEIDSTYYYLYHSLLLQEQKDSLFNEAIVVREYKENFKDSIVDITVTTETTGYLNSQSIKYTVFERNIVIRDTIEVSSTLFSLQKPALLLNAEAGVPITFPHSGFNNAFIFKGGLTYYTKKGGSYSLSYDSKGYVWVGKGITLF